MWLTRLSIQRPVFVIVLIAVFLVLGFRSRSTLQVDLNPKVDIPFVSIRTSYPGAGPAEVESQITKPLEDAVSTVNNIRHITSSSQFGISFVMLEFVVGTDSQTAAAEVRQKVDGARGLLPRDIDPPVVDRFDINAQPIMYMGVTGDRSIKQIRYLADHVIQYRLAQIPGVGRVDVTGGDEREIRVSVDKQRLEAYGLSITDVVNALGRANVNVPSGHITEGKRDYDARLVGEFQTVDQIRKIHLPVPARGGSSNLPLTLADVAEVHDTTKEREQITRVWFAREDGKLRGQDSVGIVVTKLTDANTVDVIKRVKAELATMERDLAGNIRFLISQDQSKFIEASLEDVNTSLIVGSMLAILVVFLFLHNLRGTLICAIAIPTSLIATFIPMQFAGFTLNQMTMLGLSLVVGILVDDSIVVLENIYRHLQRGETPREAAYNGRSEIGLAAITITLVDVVVFLPMAFMGGIVGQFFRQFGLTVAVSTLFSLLVSFTVTPMLASRWYQMGEDLEQKGRLFGFLERLLQALDHQYRRLLGWALRHRPHVVFGGIAALVLMMMFGGPRLKFQFIPVSDTGQVIALLELPAGAALATTDAVMRKIEERVATVADVKTIFTSIGNISGGVRAIPEQGRQYAQLSVQLNDKASALDLLNPLARRTLAERHMRTRPDTEIVEEIRRKCADIAGGTLTVTTVRGFGGAAAPVQLQLLGFDLPQMRRVAEQLRSRIATIPGLVDTDISLRPGKPEAQIDVDRVRAAELGLDVAEIGATVRRSIEGDDTAKFREAGEQFPIRVQFRDQDRGRLTDLANVVIGSRMVDGYAEPIRVGDVATVSMGAGPTKIDRKDRLRSVVVSAYLAPGAAAGSIQPLINAKIKDVPLGDIKLNAAGEAEQMQTEGAYLMSALALSIILVYLLMATLFNNLLHPLTIQLSLPMALVGAIGALVLANQTLSIISMIGFIMLVGLVQKNAILLVDYTNTLRARGMSRDEAIQEAGPTRLRPILMTTLAMVFGMLPVALAIGRASEQRAPLATAVIGGLIVSTLLTLVMIPVIYTLFDDVLAWAQRKLDRHARGRNLVEEVVAATADHRLTGPGARAPLAPSPPRPVAPSQHSVDT
jgi:HAE1 family hydrophobic/amphiphilic exporter-1